MSPARAPRDPRDRVRLLVVDPLRGFADGGEACDLARWLGPGDLLVVNDAATLPALLRGQAGGDEVEVRLAQPPEGGRCLAVLFGRGDWRTPTEHRPAPPPLSRGARIELGALSAVVESVSDLSQRLVTLRFDRSDDELLAALYAAGRPIQYAHLSGDLALWSAQTLFAGPPWAVELPSAGRPLSWRALRALREAGVGFATLTHAAGLSSTGDPRIDERLPLPERYRLPLETVDAIAKARARGGRVIAVGTTVVRALEDGFDKHGRLVAGEWTAQLVLGHDHELAVVDGILTGMHAPTESHFRLLTAFCPEALLRDAHQHGIDSGYLAHEFGDVALVLPDALRRSSAQGSALGSEQSAPQVVRSTPHTNPSSGWLRCVGSRGGLTADGGTLTLGGWRPPPSLPAMG